MLEIDIKLLPLQGVTNERALTQGVASLALGYVLHWAFSPPLLNPKLKLIIRSFRFWNVYTFPRRRVGVRIPVLCKLWCWWSLL